MKSKFLFLLLITVTSLQAQSTIYVEDCAQPTTYNYQPQVQQTYTPSGCDFEGTHRVVEGEGIVYPTFQVFAGNQFHEYLPLGYGISFQNNLWKIYMHPYLYAKLGPENALIRAEQDGFCNPSKINIVSKDPFPGFLFN